MRGTVAIRGVVALVGGICGGALWLWRRRRSDGGERVEVEDVKEEGIVVTNNDDECQIEGTHQEEEPTVEGSSVKNESVEPEHVRVEGEYAKDDESMVATNDVFSQIQGIYHEKEEEPAVEGSITNQVVEPEWVEGEDEKEEQSTVADNDVLSQTQGTYQEDQEEEPAVKTSIGIEVFESEQVVVEEEEEEENQKEQTVVIEDDVESRSQGSYHSDGASMIFEGPEAQPPFIPPGIAVIQTRQEKREVRTRQANFIEDLKRRNILRAVGPPQ